MNTEERDQLVQQAQQTIRNFTPEAIAQKTLAVYQKVLRQRK